MSKLTYDGLTRCHHESWEKCKIDNPDNEIQKSTYFDRCMWLSSDDNHCTNSKLQKKVLDAHQKEKIS